LIGCVSDAEMFRPRGVCLPFQTEQKHVNFKEWTECKDREIQFKVTFKSGLKVRGSFSRFFSPFSLNFTKSRITDVTT
jgi:hypothetical protein